MLTLREQREEENFQATERLDKDLRKAAEDLTPWEVQYLIKRYYQVQDNRERAYSQLRETVRADEPNYFLSWEASQIDKQEANINNALKRVSSLKTRPGQWCLSIFGIGHIITAGLLSHLDITKAPYPSHFWSFAGLNPTVKWLSSEAVDKLVRENGEKDPYKLITEVAPLLKRKVNNLIALAERFAFNKKERVQEEVKLIHAVRALKSRPFDLSLKVLCWKIGDSFVKVSNNPKDTMYGKIYRERKGYVIKKNEEGGYRELAEQSLKERHIRDTNLRKTYEAGKLPDGRLELGARRAAVRIFLSHLHHVMYEDHYGKVPPLPYINAHDPRHVNYIPPPNWPLEVY